MQTHSRFPILIFYVVIVLVLLLCNTLGAQCSCTGLPASSSQTVTITPQQGTSAIQSAINNATGPLTIYLANGVYSVSGGQINVINPGITIRSLSGNRDSVIIQGGGMLTGTGYHGISILRPDVTIADLTIRNIDTHGIDINFWYLVSLGQTTDINNVLLHNLHIIDCGEQLVKMSYSGNSTQSGDNGIIECCMIEYTTGLPGSNWYTNGIDLHLANNWIIRDNTIRNIKHGPNTTTDAGPAILLFNGGSGSIIERNLVINCDEGIFAGNWGNAPNVSYRNATIRNNIIRGHTNSRCGVGVVMAPNCKIINNTIYSPGGTAWTAQEYSIEVTGDSCTNLLIQNNLADEPYYNNQNLAPTPTLVTNDFNATSAYFISVNVATLDMHHSNTSPAIDAGTLSPDNTDDFDCGMRTGQCDIGADEFNTALAVDEDVRVVSTVYPNPFTNEIHVTCQLNESCEVFVELVDVTGRTWLLYKQEQQAGEFVYNGDLSQLNLASGIFFIVVSYNGEMYAERIVHE